ncbi:MAG: hypothetical protein ABIC68_03810 [Candidatus Omnitrophota bacterium]
MVIQLAVAYQVVLAVEAEKITISDEELAWIGDKIFENECGGQTKNLIHWNEGEDFLSLGIGHFIWYAKGHKGPFDESFPKLLVFMREEGVELPAWLAELQRPYCPWETKEDFMRDLNSEKLSELRFFLIETKPLQLLFLAQRLYQALPKMLEAAPEGKREHIKEQFYRLVHSPYGFYALIDYVNFKGEGVLLTERYHGQGWGLLQVLEEMKGSEVGAPAILEFVQAADKKLVERVNNSAGDSFEERWLPGWQKRIQTYYDIATR